MYGGRRPFGVSMLFVGWDKQYGYQLYQNDPSGNYLGWKATCIGSSSSAATSILESDYIPEFTSEEAVKLCVKVLYKTMTMSKLTSDKVIISQIIFFTIFLSTYFDSVSFNLNQFGKQVFIHIFLSFMPLVTLEPVSELS